MLDEIDSGLDVDSLKIVGNSVMDYFKEYKPGMLLITHYERLLDYIKPDFTHVLMNGQIVRSGGLDLMEKIDQEGYDWLKEELGITTTPEKIKAVSIGTCAVKQTIGK
jgi:Fe-S cluster assembly ATP-binding protein